MGSPASNVHCGFIMSTGAAINIDTVGFRPKAVILNNASGISAHWQKGMADASAYKRIANGTGSLVSVNGITPRAGGFTIGADAAINNATPERIDYMVFGE